MKNVLEPMVRIPGVRLAALITVDGVPVAVQHSQTKGRGDGKEPPTQDEIHSLCGLATGWFLEITRTGGLMTWEQPALAVLRASRGTMVIHAAPNGMLLAVLDRGASHEDLRLPMEGAVARVQRVLRNMGTEQAAPAVQAQERLESPLPKRPSRIDGPVPGSDAASEAPGEVGQIGNC